jgi:hypothetical protein
MTRDAAISTLTLPRAARCGRSGGPTRESQAPVTLTRGRAVVADRPVVAPHRYYRAGVRVYR